MAAPEDPKETNALLAALKHPLRRQILRAMMGRETSCPRDLAEELERSLDNVAYHMRVLAMCKAVQLVRTEQVVGSTKHLYRWSVKPKWARRMLEETEGETPGGGS